jgi:hypothetical protein
MPCVGFQKIEKRGQINMIQLLSGLFFSVLGPIIALHFDFQMGILITFGGVYAVFDALPNNKQERKQ